MPRAGWTKPDADHRLSDHLAFAMLMRVFPADVVDDVIAEVGRVQQRNRLLPARMVVYYVLGLALFPHASYEEVGRLLSASQAWSSGWSQTWPVPTKAALYKARSRLGYGPLQTLFERVAVPLGGARFLGRWHAYDLDGATLAVPDTPANVGEFGESAKGSFPTVRILGLTESATGAVVGASVGDKRQAAGELVAPLMSQLGAGRLLLAGAPLYSDELWSRAAATGADLLWELPAARVPNAEPAARVIDASESFGSPTRLLTTAADRGPATDEDLVHLFATRRRLSSAFDEFRAQQNSPRIMLRSKVPDGVRQELYGFLCVHYAMRLVVNPQQALPFK